MTAQSDVIQLEAELVREQEARLNDIPVAMDLVSMGHGFKSGNGNYSLYYAYRSPDYTPLVVWYEQEMERLGWQITAHITGDETVLVCDKPERFCVLLFQALPGKSKFKTKICIYTGIKNRL